MSRIHELPDSERPRERLIQRGPRALSDVELVTVVLGGELDGAEEIVRRFGSAVRLGDAGLGELQGVVGVGLTRACQLKAAIELGRRSLVEPILRGSALREPHHVVELLADMRTLDAEELHVLALDSRNRLLARCQVARGGLNALQITPRDVLRPALRESAATVILAHNHPSGDATPSVEDRELTRRLYEAGRLVGIELLDHVIVARDGFHSFATEIARLRAS